MSVRTRSAILRAAGKTRAHLGQALLTFSRPPAPPQKVSRTPSCMVLAVADVSLPNVALLMVLTNPVRLV